MLPLIIGAAGLLLYALSDDSDETPTRRIFISHSWSKSSYDYQNFVDKLKLKEVKVLNHSIPIEKAFDAYNKAELREIFTKQMLYCSKVYVLAKNGVSENSFVRMEIEIAESLNKEIIAIKPHGQNGIPKFIRHKAHYVISNNSASIINSLRD